ncbi:hypothetical protein [Actinomadura parmotrematis]|uniref:hypothetical protein n=1 Tax=Actinomadura parmotrematis TaxID=2864039 RepID=UPI00215D94A6|nr:hypothetical protein [Actinomadura parmotrematis]
MTREGPLGYRSTPLIMAGLVATAYEETMLDEGIPRLRVALISIAGQCASDVRLQDGGMMPADEALRAAHEQVAEAYAGAMALHGMLPASIGVIERQVRDEVRDTLDEAVAARARLMAGAPPPTAEVEAAAALAEEDEARLAELRRRAGGGTWTARL